jgi:hypothetical protein
MATSELTRELSQFPFTKLHPVDFRLRIATMKPADLRKEHVTVFVDIDDISRIVKIAKSVRILRSYSHLTPPLVLIHTYASELGSLIDDAGVRVVSEDSLTRAEGCVVSATDPCARALAARSHGRTH